MVMVTSAVTFRKSADRAKTSVVTKRRSSRKRNTAAATLGWTKIGSWMESSNNANGTSTTVTDPGDVSGSRPGLVLGNANARSTRTFGVVLARASKSAALTARKRDRMTAGAR